MDVHVLGHVGKRYFRRREWMLRDPSPNQVTGLLAELCAPLDDPEWWNQGLVGPVDGPDGVEFVVAPGTGYVALSWTGTAQRSLNPQPFADAPLLPNDGADDPLLYWPRSSFLHPADAKKALAEHISTGEQPKSVQWQPWGWEVRQLPLWLKPEMPEYGAFHLISD